MLDYTSVIIFLGYNLACSSSFLLSEKMKVCLKWFIDNFSQTHQSLWIYRPLILGPRLPNNYWQVCWCVVWSLSALYIHGIINLLMRQNLLQNVNMVDLQLFLVSKTLTRTGTFNPFNTILEVNTMIVRKSLVDVHASVRIDCTDNSCGGSRI